MPSHKYKYPEEFLTKKGTLKKNLNKKKLTEWRNTHNYDGTLITSQKRSSTSSSEDISDSAFERMHSPLEKHEQKDYLVDRNTTRKYKNKKSLKKKRNSNSSSSSSSSLEALKKDFLDGIEDGNEDDVEDIGNEIITYSDLGVDVDERIFNEYVFDNKGRILTHESCKALRDYCELNPRRCYLEREFLERYVRICKMIYKTSLYVDAFYDRIPINTNYTIDKETGMWIGNLKEEYFKKGPPGAPDWRKLAPKGFLSRNLDPINKIIEDKISNYQMPVNVKYILIDVIKDIPELSGGYNQHIYQNFGKYIFGNNIFKFVRALADNRNLMELMIQLWREGMATQTNRKPKQIEEIIRRFIKNL